MSALRRIALPLLSALLLVACGDGETPSEDPTADPTAGEATATASPEPADTATPGDDATDQATAETETEPPAPADSAETVPMSFIGPDGQEVTFNVELAADQPTRQQGLMHRTEMPPDAGMLFLFPQDSAGGFWMKNTLIPLQIAFISADGEIVDILDMVPCEEDPCEIYTPDGAYRYALEVNEGALTAAGVDETWQVQLPADLPDAT